MEEAAEMTVHDVDAREVRISSHALDRFMSRYQKITGESLTIEQALAKIRQTLADAVPETVADNPKVAIRCARHGDSQYFVNAPWRLVIQEGILMTCEIFPEYFQQIPTPKILPENRRCLMTIVIEENPAENCTVMMKSWTQEVKAGVPWAIIQFPEIVEINAVIRALRAIGIGVHYERTREGEAGERKRCILEVTVPKELIPYKIRDIEPFPRLVRISFGLDKLLPLGKGYIMSIGITKRRLEQVLAFVLNEEWITAMKELTTSVVRVADSRLMFNEKTPIKQRLDSFGNLYISYSTDDQSELISGNPCWQGQGQLVAHGGEQTNSSGVCRGKTKKEVFRKVCDELWQQIAGERALAFSRADAFRRLLRLRHIKPKEVNDENGGNNHTLA
jgi:hypothetical protein